MTPNQYNKEMSLGAWTHMFRDIYYPGQNYGRSSIELLTRLVKVFGAGSHYLFRTHDPKGSREYLAKIFAWYCALAIRLDLDLEDVLWQKYPGVCPRCRVGVCDCPEPPQPIDAEKLAMHALEHDAQRPQSLREWQVMFGRIYRGPSGKAVVPPARERLALVFSRMAEELGEIAEALAQDRIVDADADLVTKNEMADFGAWVFALANNLQYVDASAHGATLADVAWDVYPGKCHRCLEVPCICIRGSYGLELAEKGAMGPSHWDERTGLANDKALRRYLRYAASVYGPGNFNWSLIFLDLDNFGAVNKTYGHQAGDEVLRLAADRIKAAAPNGVSFRRGGEEFVVVLRTSQDQALVVAETLRRALANQPVEVSAGESRVSVTITASLGVASCLTDVPSPDQLEAAAEGRSRDAKNAGKNRVVPVPSKELLIRSTQL